MTLDMAFVDSAQMAASSGMTLPSFRVALTRSRARRDNGVGIPTDVPEPDLVVGRSPVWSMESLDAWLIARETAREELRLRKAVRSGEVPAASEPE